MIFELLYQCDNNQASQAAAESSLVPVIKPPVNPWAAAVDSLIPSFGTVGQPTTELKRLALGTSVVQTPEYQAANLPAYQAGTGGFLQHFLL